MMIGTSFGVFYPTLRLPSKTPVGDNRDVQIRARRRSDLVQLKRYIPELSEPVALKDSDYQFRAYCTRQQLSIALADLALEMDYTAFKHTPVDRHNDKALFHLYERFWAAHLSAFPTGSKFAPSRKYTQQPRQAGLTQRLVDETVIRRENREWVMAGSDPVQLAKLMKEIDAATEDVEIPSDSEMAALVAADEELRQASLRAQAFTSRPTELNGHLDHSNCTHNSTPSARKKCRKRFYGRS